MSQSRDATTHTSIEFPEAVHSRLREISREPETVAATIDRALDALEREDALPASVRDELNRDEAERTFAREGITNYRVQNGTHARVAEHNRDGETLAATVDRALDALERNDDLPDAVAAAVSDAPEA